jgi:hypothetical protein
MNSLQELNGYGSSSLTVTDSRFAGIKYTPAPPASPFTQILNIASTTVTVNAGIDITEIINYSTANVRYRVTIVPGAVNPLTGSSISWASLPAGVTLSTAGNVYTLSGINSVAQWQAVKSFTWTLPGNYATKPFWYLQISVLYYDEELGVERSVDWEAYDEDFYYVAELNASSSLTCDALDVILGSASLTGAFTPVMNFIRVKRFQSNIFAEATVSANGSINADNLYAVTSMPLAKISYQTNGSSTQSSSSTLSCTAIRVISNMIDRSYTANNKNILFATDVPQIEDEDPATTATFTITFSSSIGKFSTNAQTTATSPFSFSGTLSQCNAFFSQILFYPNAGVSSNGSFTYTQQKNAITQITRTVNLTGNAGTFTGNVYIFTSNTIWTPTYEDITYGLADYLIVGGGGGGKEYGGGGGGGQVVSATNQTSLNSLTSKTITVGIGGLSALHPANATAGGSSSITGIAGAFASGGQPGVFVNTLTYTSGGASGSGNAGGTGNNATESVSGQTYVWRSGGGGGGNGGVGGTGTLFGGSGNGGSGTGSGITGVGDTYGIGGKGGYLRVATMTSIGYPAVGYGGGGGGSGGFISGAATPTGQSLESFPSNGNSGIVVIKFHA